MTVAATTPAVTYVGNGSTTDFSFTFDVVAESDLLVTVITIATLAKSAKVLDVDYSVNLVTGEVTYPLVGSPLSSSFAIMIERRAPMVQSTSYDTQGNFSPTTLEEALDYVTMLVQQVNALMLGSPAVLRLVTYTVATLPSALTGAPALIYVRDASGGGVLCFSDGTNWRRVDTRGIVS